MRIGGSFRKASIGAMALCLLAAGLAHAAVTPQVPLPATSIPQFVQPLPLLSTQPGGTIATILGNQPLTINMCEFDSAILPPGTFAPGVQPLTRVWGYINGPCPVAAQDTYTGPVIVSQRGGASTDVTWANLLGDTTTTGVLAYKYGIDQTLHWADPLNNGANNCNMMGGIPAFGSMCAENYMGTIPAVVHLHGGEVPPEIDGGPESWYTSDGLWKGSAYYSAAGGLANEAIYKYPNTQEAGPLWFHDHTLGATRLNVYAGLAGAYFLQDPLLALPANLQPLTEVIPLVIQDRMFDTNGQLFFPADSAGGVLWTVNPEHPYWVPEFLGDTIVVNGKAWPYLSVEPRRYRFLILNGSNARTYELTLGRANGGVGPAIWVIGTDGGYLDTPVKINPALGQKLVVMPGERYEVIIDFAASMGNIGSAAGSTLVLRNSARAPFPMGAPPVPATEGQIIQFRVSAAPVTDPSYNPALGTPLRTGAQVITRLVNPATGTLAPGVTVNKTRILTLNEVMAMPSTVIDPVTGVMTAYPGGPFEVLVNNSRWDGVSPRPYGDFTPITVGGNTKFYSELPREGDTEIWEVVNLTADAHPIHLHLIQFQILNRQSFHLGRYQAVYDSLFPGGVFTPQFGPPLDYRAASNPLSGGKDGGNPDIDLVGRNGKPRYLSGPVKPPLAYEAGWKDTVVMFPGQVTRIAVRWAPTEPPVTAPAASLYFPFDPYGLGGGYVWHCHIIDHEDNEMMRPDVVTANPAAPGPLLRPLQIGVNY